MEFLNFSDPDAVAEYEAFMKSSPLGILCSLLNGAG